MTTTTSRPVCPKCGTIGKSGKSSCCGRGGSWFRNCGSAGNRKFRHTWSEGILTCKTRAQWKAVRSRQPNAAQQLNSSDGIGTGNAKVVITAAETFTFTPDNTPIPMSTADAPSTMPDIASTEYDTASFHASMTDSSTVILTTAPAYTSTLSTTTIATTTATTISYTAKEGTVPTERISPGTW